MGYNVLIWGNMHDTRGVDCKDYSRRRDRKLGEHGRRLMYASLLILSKHVPTQERKYVVLLIYVRERVGRVWCNNSDKYSTLTFNRTFGRHNL